VPNPGQPDARSRPARGVRPAPSVGSANGVRERRRAACRAVGGVLARRRERGEAVQHPPQVAPTVPRSAPGAAGGHPRRLFEPVVVGEQRAQPVGLHTPGVARRRWAITALPIADGPTEPSSKIAAAQSGQTWPCTKPGPRQRSCATRPVRAPCGCPATVPVPPATAAPAATAAAAAPTTGASAAATPSPGRRNDRPQASGEPCEESPPLVGAVMRAPGQRRAADRLPRWQD